MATDVDNMLSNKDMTATQYFQDAYKRTNAPLLEYILRSTKNIGKKFVEETEETLSDAKEKGIELEAPEADTEAITDPEADVENEETDNMLAPIENDMEYEEFIKRLEQKTIDTIVSNVTEIINNSKKDSDMEFKTESTNTVAVGLDYIQYRFMKEGVECNSNNLDEMMGYAIREATLNELDRVFNMNVSNSVFAQNIRLGHGAVIAESAVQSLMEALHSGVGDKETTDTVSIRKEPLYKEGKDGEKADVANHEMVDKNGNKRKMTDADAKKYLDPDAYNTYRKSAMNR